MRQTVATIFMPGLSHGNMGKHIPGSPSHIDLPKTRRSAWDREPHDWSRITHACVAATSLPESPLGEPVRYMPGGVHARVGGACLAKQAVNRPCMLPAVRQCERN